MRTHPAAKSNRTIRRVVEVLVVLLLLAAGLTWYTAKVRAIAAGYVPAESITLCDFMNDRDDVEDISFLSTDAGIFIRIQLVPMPKPVLPSGHPVYVFDRNGQLVDWTDDEFENPRFEDAWFEQTRAATNLKHDCNEVLEKMREMAE